MQKMRALSGRLIREIYLYFTIVGSRKTGRIVFFPWTAREGSSLLRVYFISNEISKFGCSTLVVPKQLTFFQRKKIVKYFNPALVFIQSSRHSLNTSETAFGKPYFFDLDDADFYDDNQREIIIDLCQNARGVIAGSAFIRDWCAQYNDNVTVVWTGTPVTLGLRPHHSDRRPIIAWAQSAPLGYRGELAFVRDLVKRLRARGNLFTLRLYGVNNQADREELEKTFGPEQLLEMLPTMPYAKFIRSLYDVSIGLSPICYESEFSRGKSFGKILAYLDAKVPIICSDHADHAAFFRPETGIVTNDPLLWVASAEALLSDPQKRARMSNAAFEDFVNRLSLEAAARRVMDFITQTIDRTAIDR